MASSPRAVRLALLLLVLATLSVGISGTMVRLSEAGPVATAFWRMALATPTMWLLMAAQRRRAGAPPPVAATGREIVLLVACGVIFGAELAIWHVSLSMTTVTNATLLSNASPIVVALGSWLVLGQRLSATFMAGMVLALAGCAVLMGQSVGMSLRNLWGDALALGAAGLFGVYILCVAKLRERLPTARIMTWTCGFGALALLPLPFILGEAMWPATTSGWAVVIVLALVSQAAGQSLLTAALAHLPAAFLSVAFLMVPFNAAAIAWIVLGEPVRPLQALGAAIVLAGVAVARRGSR